MYYPYFRGKQYELVLLREQATFIADNGIHPIVEPVSNALGPMKSTIRELVKQVSEFTIVVNPQYGKLKGDSKTVIGLAKEWKDYPGLSLGYIMSADANKGQIDKDIESLSGYNVVLIHYGFSDGKGMSAMVKGLTNVKANVFIDSYAGKVYQQYYDSSDVPKILIRDGFKIRRNDLYPENEHFSDLHLTFADEGYAGFGDFLIVGDQYREHGGPAYAIAVHMSYLDNDDDMHIMHFLSDRTGSPVDPGGKFEEALAKLNQEVSKSDSLIYSSDACKEYVKLYKDKHYPGLGYAKKLSMQHHIEVVAHYLSSKA